MTHAFLFDLTNDPREEKSITDITINKILLLYNYNIKQKDVAKSKSTARDQSTFYYYARASNSHLLLPRSTKIGVLSGRNHLLPLQRT